MIPADDQSTPGFTAPGGEPESRAARRSAEAGGTLRPRRIPDRSNLWAPPPALPSSVAPATASSASSSASSSSLPSSSGEPEPVGAQSGATAPVPEIERYFLCCEVPSGDFVEVILAVTDGARRRYFTTRDGDELTEVDEYYFVRRSLGDARSMLELDAREMGELEAELGFARSLRGRDPLAELAALAAEATSREEPAVPAASADAAAPVAPAPAVPVDAPAPAPAPADAGVPVAPWSSEVTGPPVSDAPSEAVVAETVASSSAAQPETDAEAWADLLRRAGFDSPELRFDAVEPALAVDPVPNVDPVPAAESVPAAEVSTESAPLPEAVEAVEVAAAPDAPGAAPAAAPHPEELMVEPVLMQWAETVDHQSEAEKEPEPEPEPAPEQPVAPLDPPRLTLVSEPAPRLSLVPPPAAPEPPAVAPPVVPAAAVPAAAGIPELVPTPRATPKLDPDSNEENPVAMMTNPTDALAPSAPVTPISAPAGLHSAAPAVAATPAVDADAAAQVALAKGIAFVAHRGQVDQVGADYIDHPGRVAEHFDAATEPVATAAAWLHDVVERSAVAEQELLEAGVRPDIVEIVVLLTRTPGMGDDEYFARIRSNPIARRVKLADVADNSSPWRVRKLDYDAQQRLAAKYRAAREALG